MCQVTKLMMPSGSFQLTSNRKKYFYEFDQCFRQFLDKALRKPETSGQPKESTLFDQE